MNVDAQTPRAGDEFIHGWIVERHTPTRESAEYDAEVWVKPKS
jgi:hypothetical protein